MRGFGTVELHRDMASMTIFSTNTDVHPAEDTVHSNSDGLRRGRFAHDATGSIGLPKLMTLHERLFPQAFPAAPPASTPRRDREHIDSRPDFRGRATAEMVMRSEMIVDVSCLGQRAVQRRGIRDGVRKKQSLHGADQPFDAAVLPGASRIAVLKTDARAPQGQAKSPRREHRFVIGAQESRRAVVAAHRDEVAPDRERRLLRHSLRAQTGPAGMVHDSHDDMLAAVGIGFRQKVHAPDQIAGNRARHSMFQFSAQTQNGVLLASDGIRDIGFADRHAAAFAEATVEAMGDRPAACLRHQGFETDEFVSDPARFRRRMGPISRPTGPGTRPERTRTALHPPEQQSAQSAVPSHKPTHETQHHDPLLSPSWIEWEGLC